jgi:hypothetical protein
MSKLYYRKVDVCSNCAFHHINNLIDYEEKIEVNESGNGKRSAERRRKKKEDKNNEKVTNN